MATLEKIKSISAEDLDINLNYGHYRPLAKLINDRQLKHGIEIGCAYGNLAEHLLNNTELISLYSIDPYKAYPDMPGISTQEDYELLHGYVEKKMFKYSSRFELLNLDSKTSFKVISKLLEIDAVPFIDFIFIDGLHTYEMVKWEIENYSTLIKPGGILSGHDITVFAGVDKAVYEYKKRTGKNLYTLQGNVWYFEI